MDVYARGSVFDPIPVSRPGIKIPWQQALAIISRYLAVVSVTIRVLSEDLKLLDAEGDAFESRLAGMVRKGSSLYFDSPDYDFEPIEMTRDSLPVLFADNGCVFFQYGGYHYAIYPS